MPGRRILTFSGLCFLAIFDGGVKHCYASRGALPPDARIVSVGLDSDKDEVVLIVESEEWDAVAPLPEHEIFMTDLRLPEPSEN